MRDEYVLAVPPDSRRWLAIAWKIWQTQQPYDEAYHLRQRARRSQRLS